MSLVTGSYDSSVLEILVRSNQPLANDYSYENTVLFSSPLELYSNQYLATYTATVTGKRNTVTMKSPTVTSPRIIPATPGNTFSTVVIKQSTT